MTNPKSNVDEDQDPILGVSVYCLQEVLLSEVKAKEGLSQNSKIYEIENLRLEQHGVIRQKGAKVKSPKDDQLGASYVDCLSGEDFVGRANFMLSYGWEYTIGDIVDTLVSFCESEQRDPKRTYIWICCLCLNQHRIYQNKVNGVETDFLEPFHRCVTTIGTVLAMMSPWDEPVYLTRVWCIYEFFTAHQNGCTVKIVMPPAEKKRMIEAACDVGNLFEALAKTKIENANASEQSDKIKIMAEVEENIGKTRLDQEVNEKLRKWIIDVLLETKDEKSSKILSLESFGEGVQNKDEELEYANLCDKVAAILYEDGNSLQAINIFKTSLNTRLKHQGVDHEDTAATRISIATILSNEGILDDDSFELKEIMSTLTDKSTLFIIHGSMLCNRGDFDGAIAEYKKAEERVKPNSITEAQLIMNIAIVMEEKGDFDYALNGYEHALDRFERLFISGHPAIASALNNIGNIYSIKGKFDEAIKLLEKARDIRLKVIGKNHQDTVTSFIKIGHAYLRQARMNDALRHFQDALSITKAITKDKVGEEHFLTADIYNGLGLVHLQMSNLREARNFFLKAQAIYKKLLGKKHPSFAMTLFNLGCTMEENRDLKIAFKIFREVEAVRIRALGDNHYLTVETYNKKGSILERMGKDDQALKEYRKMITIQSMEVQTKLLSSTAFVRIGVIYSKKGNIHDAIQSLKKAAAIQTQLLGVHDKRTLNTRRRINELKEKVNCEKIHCTISTTDSSVATIYEEHEY